MNNRPKEEQINLIEEYIKKTDGEVLHKDRISDDKGEQNVDILACLHGESRYDILGHQSSSYFSIEYRYSLIERIGTQLSDEEITNMVGEEPQDEFEIELGENTDASEAELIVEDSENVEDLPPRFRAAIKLIESPDRETNQRFIYDLFQELSHPSVSTEIVTSQNGYFQGFVIRKKIFPQDSGFNLTEFNNSVQSVVSLGTFGQNAVTTAIGSSLNFELDLS